MRSQTATLVSALGEEFRGAREARGLSLSDVAERLHIRSVYLAAIEDEDWHVIGAPVYVRGFMRTYARFLGLDAEAAVARFSSSVPAGTPAATTPRATPAPEKRTGEQTSPSLAAILAIVVAIAAVLFVGYEFYQYRAGPAAGTPVADASADAMANAAATPFPDAPAGDAGALPPVAAGAPKVLPPAPAGAAKRGMTVRVTETSWLRVAVDGTVAFEGILPKGAIKSYSGKAAVVRVGNAGGVQIAINGKAVGPLGASGDVVERRFVLSGE
jgi:cytoskeletal protein RodZ